MNGGNCVKVGPTVEQIPQWMNVPSFEEFTEWIMAVVEELDDPAPPPRIKAWIRNIYSYIYYNEIDSHVVKCAISDIDRTRTHGYFAPIGAFKTMLDHYADELTLENPMMCVDVIPLEELD